MTYSSAKPYLLRRKPTASPLSVEDVDEAGIWVQKLGNFKPGFALKPRGNREIGTGNCDKENYGVSFRTAVYIIDIIINMRKDIRMNYLEDAGRLSTPVDRWKALSSRVE